MTQTANTAAGQDGPILRDPLTVGVKTAAQATGLSPQMIRKLIRNRQLEVARVGARVLIPLDALRRLVCGSMDVT